MRNLLLLPVTLGGLMALAIPAATESSQVPMRGLSERFDYRPSGYPLDERSRSQSVKGIDDDGYDGGKSVSGVRAGRDNEELDDSDD